MKVLGKVIQGAGEGRKLGFPTANIDAHHIKGLEKGVFLANTNLNGMFYRSLAVVGIRSELEVWLLDFDQDIYNQVIEVEIGQKISEVWQIKNEQELIRKIKADIAKAKKIWGIS